MSELGELRHRIDALDTELLRLLNERATLAKEIGVIKNRASLPIYSPDREMKLLRSLIDRSNGPLRPESIRAIYREIMSASLALENDIVIACLGPSGSSTHQTALSKFGSSVRYTPTDSIAEVLAQVNANKADCGVVPLEDPVHGFINSTLDELSTTDLSICAEILPEADMQNRASGMRHIILGRQINAPTGHDQTLIMLLIEDKPGALVSALEPFRHMQVNLAHFASRPSQSDKAETFFFVQTDGHLQDLETNGLLDALMKSCRSVKILGSYPKPQP
jgi:chorismate mutase/prephenate dehydratase